MIDKIIEKLIEERVYDVTYKKTRETTEYDSWVVDSILLCSDIIELLGSKRDLFDRYEELSSMRESELLRKSYSQGFHDGIELLKEILMKENVIS